MKTESYAEAHRLVKERGYKIYIDEQRGNVDPPDLR